MMFPYWLAIPLFIWKPCARACNLQSYSFFRVAGREAVLKDIITFVGRSTERGGNAETSGSTSKAFGVRSQQAVHRTREFVFSMDMLSTWSRNKTSVNMEPLLHTVEQSNTNFKRPMQWEFRWVIKLYECCLQWKCKMILLGCCSFFGIHDGYSIEENMD